MGKLMNERSTISDATDCVAFLKVAMQEIFHGDNTDDDLVITIIADKKRCSIRVELGGKRTDAKDSECVEFERSSRVGKIAIEGVEFALDGYLSDEDVYSKEIDQAVAERKRLRDQLRGKQ